MRNSLKTLLLAGALAGAAGAASAATITPTGTGGAPADDNDLVDEMKAASGNGALTFYEGGDLLLSWAARLTFTSFGAESRFDNGFSIDGSAAGGPADLLETGDVFGPVTSISGIFAGGSLAGLLSFYTQGVSGSAVTLGHDDQFGVFVGRDGSIFLAFDDAPLNDDDNHDDWIVRVEATPVPVPAAGLLLLGALGGLAVLRRRKAG